MGRFIDTHAFASNTIPTLIDTDGNKLSIPKAYCIQVHVWHDKSKMNSNAISRNRRGRGTCEWNHWGHWSDSKWCLSKVIDTNLGPYHGWYEILNADGKEFHTKSYPKVEDWQDTDGIKFLWHFAIGEVRVTCEWNHWGHWSDSKWCLSKVIDTNLGPYHGWDESVNADGEEIHTKSYPKWKIDRTWTE